MARIFQPQPGVKIREDQSLAGKSIDEVKQALASMGHPEVLNSTHRETKQGDDTLVIFMPQAGKKG